MFFNMFFVSVADYFVKPQSAANSGHHSFGELAGFVYWLLQRSRRRAPRLLWSTWKNWRHPTFLSSLLTTKTIFDWYLYVRSSWENCEPLPEEEGTSTRCREKCRRIFELSAINRCRQVCHGQVFGCFQPAILIDGDENSPPLLSGMLLNGFLVKIWVNGFEIEACRGPNTSRLWKNRSSWSGL